MDKTQFFVSKARMRQSLFVVPVFFYLAWINYSEGDLFSAVLFLLIPLIYVIGVVRQKGKPLFTFNEEQLLVRDSFGGDHDIPLAEITGIDESPWVGIKLMVNFKPLRIFPTQLSKNDRKSFLSSLRDRTGLHADTFSAAEAD